MNENQKKVFDIRLGVAEAQEYTSVFNRYLGEEPDIEKARRYAELVDGYLDDTISSLIELERELKDNQPSKAQKEYQLISLSLAISTLLLVIAIGYFLLRVM